MSTNIRTPGILNKKEDGSFEYQIINEWQLCPKCGGQGLVSKPPWIAGDVLTWSSSTAAAHQCDLCNGKKIISKVDGLPPNDSN